MKAQKLIGVAVGAALTMSTVFGSAMPVFAEAIETPAAAETAAETTTVETQAPVAETSEQTVVPAPETPAEPAAENPVPAEPAAETPVETPAAEGTPAVAEENVPSAVEENTPAAEPEVQTSVAETEEHEADDTAAMLGASAVATTGFSMSMLTAFSDDEGQAGIAADSLETSLLATQNAPAYTGIEINGDFSQWDGVEKTTVDDGNVKNIGMVFDKDVYIYVEGEDVDWGQNDIATGAGVHSDGMFVLTTDTGRQLVFYLNAAKNYVTDRAGNEIEGSEVYYDNATHQFEIKIPSTELKQYKETISLGYYLDAQTDGNGNVIVDEDGNQIQHQIISDVADLSQSGLGTTPNEISFDGNYGDWDSYSHHLIQYSTHDADAEGALYSDGDNLMMHVQTYKASGRNQINNFYQDIAIRFNHDEDPNHTINIKMMSVDANGNISYPSWQDLYQTQPGTYEYYLYDLNGWGLAGRNINDPGAFADQWNGKHDWVYGKIIIKVTPTGTEMEVQTDMSELADRMSTKLGRKVDTTDLKYIQTKFVNIGDQWISCAGTSTGPVPGILMGAGIAVIAAWGYKKKEKGEVSAQG